MPSQLGSPAQSAAQRCARPRSLNANWKLFTGEHHRSDLLQAVVEPDVPRSQDRMDTRMGIYMMAIMSWPPPRTKHSR